MREVQRPGDISAQADDFLLNPAYYILLILLLGGLLLYVVLAMIFRHTAKVDILSARSTAGGGPGGS